MELRHLSENAVLKGRPSGEEKCENCRYYLEPTADISYCWHPKLRILVGPNGGVSGGTPFPKTRSAQHRGPRTGRHENRTLGRAGRIRRAPAARSCLVPGRRSDPEAGRAPVRSATPRISGRTSDRRATTRTRSSTHGLATRASRERHRIGCLIPRFVVGPVHEPRALAGRERQLAQRDRSANETGGRGPDLIGAVHDDIPGACLGVDRRCHTARTRCVPS